MVSIIIKCGKCNLILGNNEEEVKDHMEKKHGIKFKEG